MKITIEMNQNLHTTYTADPPDMPITIAFGMLEFTHEAIRCGFQTTLALEREKDAAKQKKEAKIEERKGSR